MTEYVYGIVETGTPVPAGEGIDGAPLRLIKGDSAAALVSAMSTEEVQLGREALFTHARVVGDVFARGTVLPMRFGVVMERPEEVRQRLLDGHEAEYREQLRRLAGKVEIEIRATYDEDVLMREIVRDRPAIARAAKGLDRATYAERVRIGELIAAAVNRAREIDGDAIVEVLSQVSEAVDLHPLAHERVACNASFLVARERLAEFDSVLDAFAEGQGGRLRFKYTGPLPPHSFVEPAEAD